MNSPGAELAATAEQAVAMPGYDRIAQSFHWLTAALMIALVMPLGIYAAWIGDGATRTYLLENWHKPFGLLVMVLTLARLVWKGRRPAVRDAAGLRSWELALARSAHWLLHALLLSLPLSGLLMSQGAGRPTPVFGLFTVPQVLPLDPSLAAREQLAYRLGKLLHGTVFNWVLYAVLFLHVAGALKHRFIDGDGAYLGRMWGRNGPPQPRQRGAWRWNGRERGDQA